MSGKEGACDACTRTRRTDPPIYHTITRHHENNNRRSTETDNRSLRMKIWRVCLRKSEILDKESIFRDATRVIAYSGQDSAEIKHFSLHAPSRCSLGFADTCTPHVEKTSLPRTDLLINRIHRSTVSIKVQFSNFLWRFMRCVIDSVGWALFDWDPKELSQRTPQISRPSLRSFRGSSDIWL